MIKKDLIVKLRQRTGAGIMECKEALKETEGKIEEAIVYLRKKGLSKAKKRASRKAEHGAISAYIHTGGKVGALIEVNCETDFVSRNETFQKFVKDMAMQIVAANPAYLKRKDVPLKVIEKEKDILSSQVDSKKPEEILEKILQGKLEKYFKEICLLEQPFIKNPEITVEEHLHQHIARIGEKLEIKRFSRFKLGEEID
ncbi:MAG: translation elongation factor Ts [Candidatus Ratteibacteria bacterium]|nr:translation elongation factor Ts [Candidatus Ratteibacteria bacterium]